jgi:tRNA (mo5U34)-methyltransferase
MAVELSRPAGYGPQWNQLLAETGWWHSFELPDGTLIRGVCELAGLKNRIAQFPIPQDLRGKRVLDIGAWDGWFSFEMERRGAEVVAIDCWDNPRFHQMRAALNSKVEYREMDVYELSPKSVGRFDIVLFMGVLYHLKHPLLALEKVCSVATELAAVDSYILAKDADLGAQPVLEFYETDEFEGQTDNWVAPNLACLLAMCRTAGFARVELRKILQFGACVACFRKWSPEIRDGAPAAELTGAVHNTNGGINFDSRKDEYLTAYFQTTDDGLRLADIQPQVGDFGVRPLAASKRGEGVWQINFKLPPGLAPGWHPVTLRLKDGAPSHALRIAVDVPLADSIPAIKGVCDGTTWEPNRLDLARGDVLAIWATGLPENADANNVRVAVNGERCKVMFLEAANGGDARQMNVRVPGQLRPGPANVSIQVGSRSSSAPITIA